MCIFCATAPTVLSVGLAARHQQRERQEKAASAGLTPASPSLPIGKLTAAAMTLVVVAAAVYHTHVGYY
jgi:hypothetical protein